MRIAVIGASGRIGGAVAEVLRGRGHEVVGLTRAARVDAYSGAGLGDALAGVAVVVDASNAPSTETAVVTDFFRTVARNVQREAASAGVRRIAVVSIVGIDGLTAGHYAGKLAHEGAYREGPVPVRIVRATQFHEFAEMILEWTTRGDTADVPAMPTRLVEARAVAEKLADIAVADAGPDLVEIAGPEEQNLADAAAKLAARRGNPAHVRGVEDTADPNWPLVAAGVLRGGTTAIVAGPTFDEWLDRHYPTNTAQSAY